MKAKLLFILILFIAVAGGLMAQGTDPGVESRVHSWNFEDGSASDVIGSAHGAPVGNAYFDGGDLVIDANGSYVELTASAISINTYSAFSVSAWFTTPVADTNNTGFHMVWYFGGSAPAEGTEEPLFGSNGFFLSPARGDNVCRTAISCGNVDTPWSTENGVNRSPEMAFGDSMYHVISTINDTYIAMYVNGVLIDTVHMTGNNSIANLSNDFAWIGRGGYGNDPVYRARVHEVTVYNKELSADEVEFVYLGGPDWVGVDEYNVSFNPNIYSSNGLVYIKNLNNAIVNSVEIYDMVGKLVYNTNEFKDVIYTNLPSSIYIVKVKSNYGEFNTKLSITK